VLYLKVGLNIIALRLKKFWEIDFTNVGIVIVENCSYYDTVYGEEDDSYDLHFVDLIDCSLGSLLFLDKRYQHGSNIVPTMTCPTPLIFFLWCGKPMKLKKK
jgi:hypothetical protein